MRNRSTYIVIFLLLSLISYLISQSDYFEGDIRRRENQLFGFIDKRGVFVIKPSFLNADSFMEGLAAVQTGSRCNTLRCLRAKACKEYDKEYVWGFINNKGQMVIKPRFHMVSGFSEGMSVVLYGDNCLERRCKWGYIDKTGRMLIHPQFYDASPFSEGLAFVNKSKKCRDDLYSCEYNYINKKGEIVINGRFKSARAFSTGLAAVETCDSSFVCKWGFIDKSGKTIIDPRYYDVLSGFSEGLAAVRITDPLDGDGKAGFINSAGEIVIKPKFCTAGIFSFGLASVSICDDCRNSVGCKWGFINKSGAYVVQPRFDTNERFTEGLAPFTIYFTGFGFFDVKGNVAIKPAYLYAKNFSEGLAAVSIVEKKTHKTFFGRVISTYSSKIGYIDKSGRMVIKPRAFREAGFFHDGLAAVMPCEYSDCR